MPNVLSSELQCRTPWIFLYFMLSGTYSVVTVQQTPVLVTSLAHDVILQCDLMYMDEKLTTIPVLYWEYLNSDNPSMWPRLWPHSKQYEGRVERLDNNLNSQNKSIRFMNVQWEDSGTYQCKLSISTERNGSERVKGNGTMLRVYDAMFFNTTAEDDTHLQCAVNVSWDPGFVLSVSHGRLNQTLGSISRESVPTLPYLTLFKKIPLRERAEYECQLRLNETLILKKIFSYNPAVPDEMYPEPWLLYMAILLVPFTTLLVLSTALLIWRH